jgi:hypothetical protein
MDDRDAPDHAFSLTRRLRGRPLFFLDAGIGEDLRFVGGELERDGDCAEEYQEVDEGEEFEGGSGFDDVVHAALSGMFSVIQMPVALRRGCRNDGGD